MDRGEDGWMLLINIVQVNNKRPYMVVLVATVDVRRVIPVAVDFLLVQIHDGTRCRCRAERRRSRCDELKIGAFRPEPEVINLGACSVQRRSRCEAKGPVACSVPETRKRLAR